MAGRLKLTGYRKTRIGVVKKVHVPNPSDSINTEVKRSTEKISHLIDVCVATKYDSDVKTTTHTITQSVANRIEEFKEQLHKDLENNLPSHVRSLVLQINDEYSEKRPMENSGFINFPSNIHTPRASANNVVQPHVPSNSDQGGRNYESSSANNFMPSVAAPTISTSVPQNHNSNNRSASSNSSTPPLLTVNTGIPCGPVTDSYFNGSPLQASQAQISLPEFPSRASVPSAPQTSSL